MSQGAFEALVADYPDLISCAKGLMVNLWEAQRLSADTFTMTDGTLLPVSRRKTKEVQQLYEEHLFRKMRKEMLD